MEKVTKVININGEEVEVDENCAEMVLLFNEIGLKTEMCCEGHNGAPFRIWFDVDDETMMEFIKKVGKWTEYLGYEADSGYAIYEGVKGLEGWILKRPWYPRGKYKVDWIYQIEGISEGHKIKRAQRDLQIIRWMYFGENEEQIQELKKEYLNICLKHQKRQLAQQV